MKTSARFLLSAFVLSLFSLSVAAPAVASDCLDRFESAIHDQPLSVKTRVAMSLGPKDLECLYESAGADPIEPGFYLDEAHRSGKVVQAFVGKNSLPVGKRFEKHFFSGPNDGEVYGYNEGAVTHLLRSPGFFRVVPNDSDRSAIDFDYREDLVSLLKGVDLSEYRGAAYRTVRNNGRNLIFSGLVDVMKKLDEDVAIGQAVKNGRAQSTFILVRKP